MSAPAAVAHDVASSSDWDVVIARAPRLAATMIAYLGGLSRRLKPRSVDAAELCLRQFALHVVLSDPGCQSVRDVTTIHVARWKRALEDRDPGSGERQASAQTIAYKLATLKRFFDHLAASPSLEITAIIWPTTAKRTRTPSISCPPRPPKPPSRALPRELEWDEIAAVAPQLATTMTAYLGQLSVSHRPTSVVATSLALRHRGRPAVSMRRRHHPGPHRGLQAGVGRPAGHQDGQGHLDDDPPQPRPRPQLLRAGDRLGLGGRPEAGADLCGRHPQGRRAAAQVLGRPDGGQVMATLADDPDRRRRLLVELLARTGMRAGELCGIRDDAMYRVGDTWWLKIPLGKLHNDRHVPLHPLLVGLITDYRMWRGPSANGFLLERDDGRPFDRRTVHRYVQSVAKRAGVGKVHPHQLRHTLATQCLNRGMSLEAIAALLGHRSPRMTLVYARISNENVADQYFKATNSVEADAKTLDDRDRRAQAQADEHRRLLGNSHCTRPSDLDCRFQTICEGCGFFETGPQFVEILSRQRDDATAHIDRARAQLYGDLVSAIDASSSGPGQPGAGLVG